MTLCGLGSRVCVLTLWVLCSLGSRVCRVLGYECCVCPGYGHVLYFVVSVVSFGCMNLWCVMTVLLCVPVVCDECSVVCPVVCAKCPAVCAKCLAVCPVVCAKCPVSPGWCEGRWLQQLGRSGGRPCIRNHFLTPKALPLLSALPPSPPPFSFHHIYIRLSLSLAVCIQIHLMIFSLYCFLLSTYHSYLRTFYSYWFLSIHLYFCFEYVTVSVLSDLTHLLYDLCYFFCIWLLLLPRYV